MIHNRLISSKSIIAKVIADLQLPESDLPITDIKEYILEGLLKIGAIQQYEHKVAVLPIVGHQAALPCDLYKLGQVAFSFSKGGWLPMRKSTSSFGVFHDNKVNTVEGMLFQDDKLFPLVKSMFHINSDREALDKLNEDPDLRKTLSTLLNRHAVNTVNGVFHGTHTDSTMFSRDLQYMTKPGYIMTNAPEGFVKISYYAIYTDEEGMPMIPDMESFKEAIFWYVTTKLLYPKRLKGLVSDKIYYDAQNSWNFYRKQAYAEAMMPSGVDDMATISNNWQKLYPEINEQDTFMSTIGEEQNIYNQL